MRERAAATEATRARILQAALKVGRERWFDEVTLREIAAEAGVALQTVVNHFGTKEGVLTATFESGLGRAHYMENRERAPVDDVAGAVELLVADYERVGDALIRALALEGRIAAVGPLLKLGRREHRAWVRRVFPAALAHLSGAAHRRRVDLLVCATDVYTWKLLRRDRGLSRPRTAAALAELVGELHPASERSPS